MPKFTTELDPGLIRGLHRTRLPSVGDAAPAIGRSNTTTQGDSPDHRDKASSGTVSPQGGVPLLHYKEEAT